MARASTTKITEMPSSVAHHTVGSVEEARYVLYRGRVGGGEVVGVDSLHACGQGPDKSRLRLGQPAAWVWWWVLR